MKYKLIVSDLDDTLLNDHLGYSQKLADTVAEYTNAGGRFTIATGRMTEPMLELCQELHLKGKAISYQGAVICDIESGKILEEINIPNTIAYEVCNYLERLGVYFQLYKKGNILIKNRTAHSERYAKLCRCGFIEHKEGLSSYLKQSGLNPIKFLIIEEPEKIPAHIKELQAVFGDRLLINTSKNWVIEIVNKEINKGKAVERLANSYGLSSDEVICIGDSDNDISMIEYAGLGVCVANGNKDLKSIAQYICPTNNEDGVAHVINKFGLEKSV
ncbi:MAG: Cof-type HAD-IIB family hydrolase [Clostridia bacterium]|nr:Cof-type HAD-IIB family hydrolase [Clostridia bacterium]